MESIHKPETRLWIVPGKLKVRKFIEMWKNEDIEMELSINRHNMIEKSQEILDINKEMIDLLEEECSPNVLNCDGENESIYASYEKTFDFTNNINLETVRLQKHHLEAYKNNGTYRTAVLQSLRYRNYTIRENVNVNSDVPPSDSMPIDSFPEAILTVQFYRPIRHETHFGVTHRYAFVADQELDVLASQSLTELRDAFTCVSDITNPGDCSDEPLSASVNTTANEMYKSGFFFIDNTFYNDMRDDANRDYSAVIRKWSEEPGRGIGPFSTARMEHTKFVDLTIQLGYPYLYMHQGDCEHVIVFSDIRLLVPNSDSMNKNDYPKIVGSNRRMQIRCGICDLNTSKWVTFDNKRLPEDPFFFCESCFLTFNYDNNSQKIGQFKAYPYLDKTAFL